VLRKAIAANKALAELKGAGDDSESERAAHTTGLQEAKLSSEIEDVVTPAYVCGTKASLGYVEKS
jgi:Fic/DOC family protein